jgi:hypothetical protein
MVLVELLVQTDRPVQAEQMVAVGHLVQVERMVLVELLVQTDRPVQAEQMVAVGHLVQVERMEQMQ